jgi:pimeloyl-ACP methyl ester carboxylesterase
MQRCMRGMVFKVHVRTPSQPQKGNRMANALMIVNWYRTRRINFDEEQVLVNGKTVEQPALFIAASRDNVLYPELAANMGRYIPQLTTAEVDGTHWVLVEKPDECNELLRQWFGQVVWGGNSKL